MILLDWQALERKKETNKSLPQYKQLRLRYARLLLLRVKAAE
jgi:hypothetical protein